MAIVNRRRRTTQRTAPHTMNLLFMTESLHNIPEDELTTEQNLIVRIGKSEAKAIVGGPERLRSRDCNVEANCWQTRSIARPLCDSGASGSTSGEAKLSGLWIYGIISLLGLTIFLHVGLQSADDRRNLLRMHTAPPLQYLKNSL